MAIIVIMSYISVSYIYNKLGSRFSFSQPSQAYCNSNKSDLKNNSLLNQAFYCSMVFAVTLPFLYQMVALFIVSVAIAYICYRFNIVSIVGFLLAGVCIGPHALGLVQDHALIDILAEVGIILLLFTIGMEFSLDKLARIKSVILIGGGLQVGLTTG